MRKRFLALGLILVIVGLAVLVFPRQEPSSKTVEIFKWDLSDKTLEPQKKTFFMQFMRPEQWFQLDVSSNSTVELEVLAFSDQGAKNTSVFSNEGTRFTQKITVSLTGSYEIDITNIGSSNVTLAGNVVAQRSETSFQTQYPFAFPGFLLMLGGTMVLFFGIFRKPKIRLKPKS